MTRSEPTRVVVAVGGNAIEHGGRHPSFMAATKAVDVAMTQVAQLVSAGCEIVLTHGNGPQVGALALQNELASPSVPRTSLDACVAQTQALLGMMMLNSLTRMLPRLEATAPVAALVTRVVVDPRDKAFSLPTKPIGGYHSDRYARTAIRRGEQWKREGTRGWRRVVPSPEPLRVVESDAISALLRAGIVVIAAGGGGVPVVERGRSLKGIEAVLDKDLTASLLARQLGAKVLVIGTDVSHVSTRFGTPHAQQVHAVSPTEIRRLAEQGHFPVGSMGPKVEAAARFVEGGGSLSVITSLENIGRAPFGRVGTVVAQRTVGSVTGGRARRRSA